MYHYCVLSNILCPRQRAIGKADKNNFTLLMELISLWEEETNKKNK